MSAGLDLSGYDDAVCNHLLFGLARARAFGERIGNADGNVDLTLGTIDFGAAGSFPVQILGTWAHDSDTFLWAWANPGASSWGGSVGFANQLRQRGQTTPGFAGFTEAKISPKWIHPMELGLVAADLVNAPLCTVERGQATVLLVVGRTGFEDFSPDPVHLMSLVTDASRFTTLSARRFVEPFLARLTFALETFPAATRALRADASLELHWDEEGRLVNLGATFEPRG
jgi:hypothetical protein